MFEAVGAHAAGKITDEDLCEFENKACPTCGSCSGMYTANSMNCLTEALGMGLRGNGTIPAVYSARIQLAKHAGMQVMELVRKNIRPRDIMTEDAILNALTVDMALGCSTNSMLHLPAIAHEIGMDFEIDFANEISEKTQMCIRDSDDNMQVTLNRDSVREWMRQFGETYDTVGSTRSITTPTGKTTEVSGGTYGWSVDEETETDALITSIQNGEVISKEPAYEQKMCIRDRCGTSCRTRGKGSEPDLSCTGCHRCCDRPCN